MLNVERVLSYIHRHRLMRPGDRLGVAVSGGADSVALLRLLLDARAELGIVLSVVHFNHKIRGADADADEHFVRRLAQAFDLEFHADAHDTPAYAREHKLSLEDAARKLRYAFFDRLLASGSGHAGNVLDRIATAHTRDDQAETVLLRILRGAGTRGLAGIHPQLRRAAHGTVARPLLETTRAELRQYVEALGQSWREDVTNRDLSYARNRVRHELLPLLAREYNPAIAEVLSDTAAIARAEEEYWQEQVRCLLPGMLKQSAMRLDAVQAQPLALQRRLVRALAEQSGVRLEFRHVEQILALVGAQPTSSAHIELPHGWEAVRQDRELWFRRRCQSAELREYDVVLPVPGEVDVAGRKIRASLVRDEAERGSETRATRVFLDPALAERGLLVRNWHAGDRYWPAHTSGPKKLKDLLQAPHILRAQKPYWPVVASGTLAGPPARAGAARDGVQEIVWVPGFPAPEQFRVREPGSAALLLEEVPAGPSGGNET